MSTEVGGSIGGSRFPPVTRSQGCSASAASGAGLSCIAPQVFSAAGNRDPARAGQAIARVAGLGFLGFVVGPVLIGGAAHLGGLAAALAIPAILALFVAGTAAALRTPAR